MKVFNGNDLFHVFLAGQLAEFGCIHGIKKDQFRSEHFKELFEVILLESKIQIGAELDELEQLYIQKQGEMTQ